ncbi:maleylpyruvate isomerase N-terminal domain-containing protein [Nocardia pseudobrasiliensis]|uniref:Mycothiol maleylpyruvate isomerase-like protein n=1 Tax=Nocardia pseudobrasiliensis TaxID=45979 RepID=A0A370I8D1_9NOCA|nr:maleylpyruvate isomerase N-terminal domain-containing protein [Nocardia pseudobrasiliensis]RDI66983.1 mycothiol maleylpyruvate isomerase-like protein [Nocardia pseudobrasiliensis]
MSRIRDVYLEAAASAARLLSDPAIGAAWERPSVLKEFSVRGLAGHLGAQILHVSRVLVAEAPQARPVTIAEFFDGAEAFQADTDAEINVRIREGGESVAADGAEALAAAVESTVAQQLTALPTEPHDRIISFAQTPMLLDDFLLTRMLEIVVHSDDLALSADIPTPAFPPHVFEPVLDLLSRLAVTRHGQPAVLRALSRAERAPDTIAGI